MTISTERFPGEPIIYVSIAAPVRMPEDPLTVLEHVVALKREVGKPVYRILDFSQARLNFGHMMQGIAADQHREGGVDDPDVITIFVGPGDLIAFGVQVFEQQAQLLKKLAFFTTREDALAYARAEIAREQDSSGNPG